MGRKGIEDAYRTGRGSIIMRAVVEVEEIQNRQCLVVTELPYQVNPDNLAQKIAELVKDGRIAGIADIRDETSGRTGQRLVDRAQARRRGQGRAEQPLQAHPAADNFGANMLALVDGVPRTLPLDGVHPALGRPPARGHRAAHAATGCARPRSEAHILRGLLKALDALDEVIALIRASPPSTSPATG